MRGVSPSITCMYNAQGDVVGLADSSGKVVVEYTYDAWGNPLSITGTLANTLGQFNPLRYRGYVWDGETGLYYLQSRYYNPSWGRWINGDSQLNPEQYSGYNMFAYCKNDPVNIYDPTGHCGVNRRGGVGTHYEPGSNSCCNKKKLPKGETFYPKQLSICTDGAPEGVIPDGNWKLTTAYGFHNHKPDPIYLNALNVNYIVLPDGYKGNAGLGNLATLTNLDTGEKIWCIIGESGNKGDPREVSIAAVWNVGFPDHMTAKRGVNGDFEITLYPGTYISWRDLDWNKPIQPQINARGGSYR